jgi:hypothetical protein
MAASQRFSRADLAAAAFATRGTGGAIGLRGSGLQEP